MVFTKMIAVAAVLFGFFLVAGCSTQNKKPVIYTDPLGAAMVLSAAELSRQKAQARKGDQEAIRRVYEHYEFGEYDEIKSVYWLRKLAETGDAVSQYNLGQQLIEQGQKEAGAMWIQKAFAQGFRP